jgi:hypothetical protein
MAQHHSSHGFKNIIFVATGKPQYNESEGIKDFVLCNRDFCYCWGLFTIESITEGRKIKSLIAGILL